MKYCLVCFVLVLFFMSTEAFAQRGAKSVGPLEELEGTWELAAYFADGRLIDVPPTRLVISANRWRTLGVIREHFPDLVDLVSEGAKEFSWDQKACYLEKTPGGVDLLPQGSLQTDQGEEIPSAFGSTKHAIYRIRGDILDVCEGGEIVALARTEYPRPSSFASTPDLQQVLRVYHRVKASNTAQLVPDPRLKVGQPSIDESRIENIEVEHGRVTVRKNEITVKGGTVRIKLK